MSSHAETKVYDEDLEAQAVEEAIANADDSFTAAPSLLNSADPHALLLQVDGPDLSKYQVKESVYVGMSVPVALRATSVVPLHVTTPGSVVEYSIETKNYDISISVVAEREEGVTIVRVSLSLIGFQFTSCHPLELPTSVPTLTGNHCHANSQFPTRHIYYRKNPELTRTFPLSLENFWWGMFHAYSSSNSTIPTVCFAKSLLATGSP